MRQKQTFVLVDDDLTATLSGEASVRLGFVVRVAAVEEELYETTEHYRDVFRGLGQVKDVIYSLKLKPDAQGTVKLARRFAVTPQEKVKAELERMEASQVIEKLTIPTEWSSYMVVVVKKDKVWLCLDPLGFNEAQLKKYYPVPTLEDIAPNLSEAKHFSKLDSAFVYWQITLDDESSIKFTMSTPYGRYRFLRMPFGI